MIRISNQARELCAVLSAFLLIMLAPGSVLLAADPPPLTDTDSETSFRPPAPGVDAQRLCAAPVADFQHVLARAMAADGIKSEHKRGFKQQLQQCRSVYEAEMERLKADFTDLPQSSVCHSAQRDLREGLEIFDAIEQRAQQLTLDTEEDRQAAGVFFSRTSPGLVRAVNGLYLLRHGVCMEEQRAPFDAVLTDPDISHPALYLE